MAASQVLKVKKKHATVDGSWGHQHGLRKTVRAAARMSYDTLHTAPGIPAAVRRISGDPLVAALDLKDATT